MRRFHIVCWGDPEDSTWDIVDVTGVTDDEWHEAARPDDDRSERPWVDAVILAPSMVLTRPTDTKHFDGSWNLLTFEQFKVKAESSFCLESSLASNRHSFVLPSDLFGLDPYDPGVSRVCRFCKRTSEELAIEREERIAAAGRITRTVGP